MASPRIWKAVGDPVTCPFGKPIPGSRYKPPSGKVLPMNQAKPGHAYQVSSLPDEDSRLREFLCQHNLLPGQKVEILEIGDYRDVITFRTNRGEAALGFATASRIHITEPNEN